MNFAESIKTCLIKKPLTFKGRASRSEYWWFILFLSILNFVLGFLGQIGSILIFISNIPQISVASRRLHDSDLSGWLQLLPLGIFVFSTIYIIFYGNFFLSWILCLGAIGLAIYLYSRKSTQGPNRFGDIPDDIVPVDSRKLSGN